MVKSFLSMVFLIFVTVFVGCGSPTNSSQLPAEVSPQSSSHTDDEAYSKKTEQNSTPVEVFLFYFTSLQEGRISEARTCLSKDTITLKTDDNLKAIGSDIRNFQVFFNETKGNFAKIVYYITRNDESVQKDTLYLVRENNFWKITEKTPNPNPFGQTDNNHATSKVNKDAK